MRNFIRICSIALLLTICVFLGFNLFFVKSAYEDLQIASDEAKDIEVEIVSLSLPLKIIDNIQYISGENLNDMYEDSYTEQIEKGMTIVDTVDLKLQELETTCNDSKIKKLDWFEDDIAIINRWLREVAFFNQSMSEYLSLNYKEQKNVSDFYVITVENSYFESSNKLYESITVFENKIHDKTNSVFSILSAITGGLLLILGVITFKRDRFHHHFIEKSYKLIEHQNYDFGSISNINPWFKEEKILYDQVKELFYEEQFHKEIKAIVTESYDLDSVVEHLFMMAKKQMEITRIGIAFVDYQNEKILTELTLSDNPHVYLKAGYKVGFKDTSVSEVLKTKKGIIMNDLEKKLDEKPDSKSLSKIFAEGIRSNLCLPFMSSGRVFGLVFISSNEKNYFTNEMMTSFSKVISELTEVLKRSYLLKVVIKQFTFSFSELVDNKDIETGDHLSRMTKYADVLTNYIYNNPKPGYVVNTNFIKEVHDYASIHDIGKVAIPDSILKKPGRLTAKERIVMENHVEVGCEIIKNIRRSLSIFDTKYFQTALEIIGSHHERWDGKGYPHGKKGHSIPLSARIVTVADVFDALTSKRVYKRAISFDESTEIIFNEKGKQFDPYLVECFRNCLPEIYTVYKDNKEIEPEFESPLNEMDTAKQLDLFRYEG